MKKYLALIPLVFLIGCVGVPVKRNFPKTPESLQQPAPQLKEVPPGATASEVMSIVIDNYGSYHQVANELAGWQQWYQEQKQIFEDAN